MYSLFWRSPALSYIQKQNPIAVPAGAIVSNAASLRFTGKGATNYGKIQQENLLRLLENFAGDVEPDFPTVGQAWYDTAAGVLKVCATTAPSPLLWKSIGSTQISVTAPPNPSLGESWFMPTGSSSGVLYVFSGVGRYPQVNWDATNGYYPPASTARANIILNSSVYGPANTNYNEGYVHGFTAGVAADVNGLINTSTTLPKGVLATQHPVIDGYIVYDQSSTMTGAVGQQYFIAQQTQNGRWYYDNNTNLVEFTPNSSMLAVGRVTVSGEDVDQAPGLTAGVMWNETRTLTAVTQVIASKALAAIGGWEQVWPAVEVHGGRDEYDYMYGQLAALIGDPIMFGGSGAEGRYIQNLTDFKILDASMQRVWALRTPTDAGVNSTELGTLKVDPNSQDWDKLLAACRYAVARLELPAGMIADLASQPFVQDGLSVDTSLTGIVLPDPRAIPNDRRTRTRAGAITVFSQYQETANVLRAAIQQRYLLRGLLESSGVGNTFNSTVGTANQASFSAAGASFSGTTTHGLIFDFPVNGPEAPRFFNAGQALQLVLSHSGTSTPVDLTLRSITNTSGRIRITGDNTFVMSPAIPASLTQVPSNVGFRNFTAPGGPSSLLATMTSGSSVVSIRGLLQSSSSVLIYVDITGGGALTGTFSVMWSYIQDTAQYGANVRVYPVPAPYIAAHKYGSSIFV